MEIPFQISGNGDQPCRKDFFVIKTKQSAFIGKSLAYTIHFNFSIFQQGSRALLRIKADDLDLIILGFSFRKIKIDILVNNRTLA